MTPWDIIGWIILALTAALFTALLINISYTFVKERLENRRKRKAELDYLVSLFKHPSSPHEKPKHFCSDDEQSLTQIIREYSGHARLLKTQQMLKAFIEELGYEITVTKFEQEEKFNFKKKIPF